MEQKDPSANEQAQETAVAKAPEAGLPAELQGFTGMEDITEDALIIPRMKIVQPTSKEGTPGNFLLNLTGEEFPEVTMTVIKAQRGRIMWDKGNLNNPPLCRSYDFENPDPGLEDPQGDRCMEYVEKGGKKVPRTLCKFCKWGGKGEPPACSEVYNLLCISDDGIPFWYATSPTSVKAVRRYISAIYLKRSKLFEYKVTAYLEMVTNDQGKFYILKFKDIRKATQEELVEMAGSIIALKDESIARTYEAEEAMGDDLPGDLQGNIPGDPGIESDEEAPF